jgi:putative ABC transport system permease protein
MLPRQLRYVIRKLTRAPLFTFTAIVTLAVGIGANSAIFSVVNGILLKPLPFEDPDRLVGLWHTAPGLGFDQVNQSPALHFTYRDENRVFEDVAMWDNRQVAVTGLEEPEQLPALLVTAGFFELLGVRPQVGRTFTEEDDLPGGARTIMLGYGYWQRAFGGDPTAIGRTLTVQGEPHEIIGVAPPYFEFARGNPDVIMPSRLDRARVSIGNFDYQGIARLQDGVTVEQANTDIARMIPLATELFPGGIPLAMLENAGFAPLIHSLKQDFVGDVGNVLWILLGTVGLVLLIACANVANLFLVRAEGRQREVAVRSAIGAGRGHVARQFLWESGALGLAGGLAGLGLAYAGTKGLISLAPEGLPRVDQIGLDPVVLGFTLVVSILAGVLFGLFPVLRYRRLSLVSALKEGGRGNSVGRERHRARNGLVVAQVALALVLLVGSGLMVRSFQALRRVDPGFDRPGEVLTFRIHIPQAEVQDAEEAALVIEEIARRLEAIPGVASVGPSFSVTMDGFDSNDAVWVEDHPMPPDQIPPIRRMKWIGGGYFETMENDVLAGRALTWADVHDRSDVVVITENMAREYWPDPASAVGRRIGTGEPSDIRWREIVGVVGDVRDDGVAQDPVSVVYWPYATQALFANELFVQRYMAYAIRTETSDPRSILPEVREAVWAVNSNLPLAQIRTLDEILERSMARTSFTLIMLAIAAVVALLLGTIGIYGVISYVVSQRTREIGVRIALGASRATVSRLVLAQGAALAGIGVVIGWAAAFGLTRLMGSLLHGVEASDPLTYAVVAGAIGAVALAASYLPARRASGVDPVTALRWE